MHRWQAREEAARLSLLALNELLAAMKLSDLCAPASARSFTAISWPHHNQQEKPSPSRGLGKGIGCGKGWRSQRGDLATRPSKMQRRLRDVAPVPPGEQKLAFLVAQLEAEEHRRKARTGKKPRASSGQRFFGHHPATFRAVLQSIFGQVEAELLAALTGDMATLTAALVRAEAAKADAEALFMASACSCNE